MTQYMIGQNTPFTGLPDLCVEYKYPPPCLYCNEPVVSPSADGPLVCPSCDCGYNKDWSKWTTEENIARHKNFAKKINEIRNQNKEEKQDD
jgi:uncharacterized Zn finger protein (UPF0148 family)